MCTTQKKDIDFNLFYLQKKKSRFRPFPKPKNGGKVTCIFLALQTITFPSGNKEGQPYKNQISRTLRQAYRKVMSS